VRNLAQGNAVEVIAEGSREALAELLEHLREGTRTSVVVSIDVQWIDATGSYEDFRVAW
jgi:acylphosphatase